MHVNFLVFAIGTAVLCSSFGFFAEAGILSGLSLSLKSVPGLAVRKPTPQQSMSTPELIRFHNYTVETHNVTTEDGYILTLFRIPHGKNNTNVTKEPVFVQHGLVCSSDDWFLIDPESILPYLLSEDGHDIWLGNSRGNNYSMAHTTLSPNDTAFWNFSFHEMGIFDVPAVIDYVLNVTGATQLSWVGHSMGTTMFMIGMVRRPEYQGKVKNMVALSPVAYISHTKTPLRVAAIPPPGVLVTLANFATHGRLLPQRMNDYVNEYGGTICGGDVPALVCYQALFIIAGYDFNQASSETVAMVTSHTPSDASMKTFAHYFQFMRTGVFAEFGENGAPYNLAENNVPTLCMYADNDWLAVPQDALKTASELGSKQYAPVRVNLPQFEHLDYTYAIDVKTLVYDRVVTHLG